MKVGIIGAGVISEQYLGNLISFPDLEVVFVADPVAQRARERAERFDVGGWGDVDDLLGRDDIELVLNLTPPAFHVPVGLQILQSGKHVWSEKPIALDVQGARELLTLARASGLRVGVAPDTALGRGLQTARRLIDEGAIGSVTSAIAMFRSPGPDTWHPDPEFLFRRGAGPLYDMGPYYVTALVSMLGPIESVHAVGTSAFPTRTIAAGPRAGTEFSVEVDTHVSALLTFATGAVAQALFSFDAAHRSFQLEVQGTRGALTAPDPNLFDGDVTVIARGETEPAVYGAELEPSAPPQPTRGVGVLEMARAIRSGRPERASGQLALHVLDVLESTQRAARTGVPQAVLTTAEVAPPLPVSWNPYRAEIAE